MAETVHLFLKANGTDIHGESAQVSLGRENSIECLYFEHSVKTAREAGSGLATGKRQYEPILIRKRIDKSSPLLFKALTENHVIDADFKFFRPSPQGDGTTEQYYTVRIKKGRILSFKQFTTAYPLDAANQNQPDLEEITIVFQTIRLAYTKGGIEHEDSLSRVR